MVFNFFFSLGCSTPGLFLVAPPPPRGSTTYAPNSLALLIPNITATGRTNKPKKEKRYC